MTKTNIIQVMGTNIITNWPHTSVVTNLNADMLDGKHAEEIVATATNRMIETDPQVADNIANNYIPRWNSATTQLVSGSIFDNGNVGIGTVTPDGKIDLQAGSGGTAITISANYPDSYRWRMIPTDRGNAIDLDFTVSDSSDAQERLLQLSRSTSGRPEFALLNNQLVVNNGNVGIGTAAPHGKLDVAGNSQLLGFGRKIYAHNDPDNYYIGSYPVAGSDGLDIHWYGGVRLGTLAGTVLQTTSAGNVGIGTASPNAGLDINRAGAWGSLAIRNSYAGVAGDITYFDYPNGKNYIRGTTIIADSGGNVGIGTPSPTEKLDVNGDVIIRGGDLYIGGWPGNIQTWPEYPPKYLALRTTWDNTTELGPAQNGFTVKSYPNRDSYNLWLDNGGELYIKGYYHRFSDDRLKFNEQKLKYGLAQVMALEPKLYDRAEWKVDPETEELIIHPEIIAKTNEIGLVAQEVQRIIPEAVTIPENENCSLWSISYDTLIPVLVKAIQEQQAQIEELKREKQTLSASGTLPDTPLTADFDGDGKTDRALVSANGDWYFWLSGSEFVKIGPYNFGVTGKPVASDFDGDGKADPGMVDANGNWYVWLSANGYSQSKL